MKYSNLKKCRTRIFRSLLAIALMQEALPSGRASAAPAAADSGLKHTPFVTVLLRDWDQWDTNKDGELSVAEIDRVVMNPNVKGEDAAVAGTLKLMSRSTKVKVPPLTRDYFLKYDKEALSHPTKLAGAAAENATTDTGAADGTAAQLPAVDRPIKWDLYFNAGKSRIAKRGGPWPDKFNLDHAHQGQLGDCYLIATIGSMVIHNPSELERLVKPTDDGTYRVTIPGAQPFTLQPLTQSQLVISSTTTGQGEWLAVLEQAVGRYNEKVRGSSDDEGTDTIADGGHLSDALALLTGHQCTKIRLRTTIARREADADKTLPQLRKELISAMHDNRVITASVTPPTPTPATGAAPAATPARPSAPPLTADMLPKIPPNISIKHAYAIVSYDADTDMLEIWNPHGQNFAPKGPDGLQNGYTTKHGFFHIPLKEAYTFYSSFVFEVNGPATRPAGTAVTAGHG